MMVELGHCRGGCKQANEPRLLSVSTDAIDMPLSKETKQLHCNWCIHGNLNLNGRGGDHRRLLLHLWLSVDPKIRLQCAKGRRQGIHIQVKSTE